MIYITGDTHGEFSRFNSMLADNGSELGEGDYLVICGDFGFIFYPKGTMRYVMQQEQLNEMEKLPYTVLWVDGNHENHDILSALPTEEWKGGKIHRIRKNVIHLMRGQIFDIDGTTLFAMGGAYSIDKYMRREGISWWSGELPLPQEYREAAANLEKVGKKVDIIVTHTAPTEIIHRMNMEPNMHDRELTGFLEWIMYEVEFKKWYFGHWHYDLEINDKFRGVWFDIIGYDSGECNKQGAYNGKLLSILGDSISTFEGMVPEGYPSFYKRDNGDISGVYTVGDTWWGRVLAKTGAKLLVNNSWSGSCVCMEPEAESISYGCGDHRTSSLGRDGLAPDHIIIYMGTNDRGIGFQYRSVDKQDLSVLENAYGAMLDKIKKNYPNATVWCCDLPKISCTRNREIEPYFHQNVIIDQMYSELFSRLAAERGYRTIDLSSVRCDTIDGLHPTAEGMRVLADKIISVLTNN